MYFTLVKCVKYKIQCTSGYWDNGIIAALSITFRSAEEMYIPIRVASVASHVAAYIPHRGRFYHAPTTATIPRFNVASHRTRQEIRWMEMERVLLHGE